MIDENFKIAEGDELVWMASVKRKKDLRARVVGFTDKRIAIKVVGEGWDTSRTYYVTRICLRPLYRLRHRASGEVREFVELRDRERTLRSEAGWTSF